MKACIKCRKTEGAAELRSMSIIESDMEVGVIYACPECQPKLKSSLMDIFLNHEREGEPVH